MDKLISLLVGVAVGVALVLLLLSSKPSPPQPAPSIKGADAVKILDLSPAPGDLRRVAEATMPRPSIEYPDAALNLLLRDLPPELGVAAGKVLPRPKIVYSDSSIPYCVLEEPPPDLLKATLPKPLLSHPDTTIVFTLEEPFEELIASVAQVRRRPLVEYADAGWSGSLVPPSGLVQAP